MQEWLKRRPAVVKKKIELRKVLAQATRRQIREIDVLSRIGDQ